MTQNHPTTSTFLAQMNAPTHLVQHLTIVQETAQMLTQKLQDKLNITPDVQLIRDGALLHDIGKILHPKELNNPGHLHEAAGQKLLLEHGFPQVLARVCISHAQWKTLQCSTEELIIALADKLWKGKRVQELEEIFTTHILSMTNLNHWDAWTLLDDIFMDMANTNRLLDTVRSKIH